MVDRGSDRGSSVRARESLTFVKLSFLSILLGTKRAIHTLSTPPNFAERHLGENELGMRGAESSP